METSIDIFTNGGLQWLFRYGHVVFGVAWIGLLYYFNFVQVPAFAEMEAAARNNAIDKLASRALWWFRWAAVATTVTGLILFVLQKNTADYMKSPEGIAIATGMLLALTMFLNVWGIIWRNQKTVIANARNVQAGGEADPAAAGAGRKALLASRQNAIFSLPMLAFMVGTSHFAYKTIDAPGGAARGLYWAITGVLWIVFELNALGVFGKDPGGTRKIYDTHKAALWTGVIYAVVQVGVFMLVLK
jgi:uncharacterized membrane protein